MDGGELTAMYELSVPENFPDRQRRLIWEGPRSLFQSVCRALEEEGFDLKKEFTYDGNKIGRFIWLPRNNVRNLSFQHMEKVIREAIKNITGRETTAHLNPESIQKWLNCLDNWVGQLRPIRQTRTVLQLFEIDHLIVRGEFDLAERELQLRQLIDDNNASSYLDILRSQMFLKHRQGHYGAVWELYQNWRSRTEESLDAPLAFWVGSAALDVKEYGLAYEIFKELRAHSIEQFFQDDQIKIRLSLIKLLEYHGEWAEALLDCGSLYGQGLSPDQLAELEEVAICALEKMSDIGHSYQQYLQGLPEELLQILKNELDIDDGQAAAGGQNGRQRDLNTDVKFDEQKVNEALEYWESIYQEKPTTAIYELKKEDNIHPRLRLAAGRTYLEVLGKPEKAMEEVVGIDPELFNNNFDRLAFYKIMLMGSYKSNNVEQGIMWGNKYLENERDPEVCAICGILALEKGDADTAKNLLAIAVENGIARPEIFVAYGQTLADHSPAEASKQFLEALKVDPTCKDALEWLALVEENKIIVLGALKGYFYTLQEGLWASGLKEKYVQRLDVAREVNRDRSGQKEEDLLEAYMDMTEYYLRQTTPCLDEVKSLLKAALGELENGESCLELLATLEIIHLDNLEEIARSFYLELAYRFMKREQDLVLIERVLRRMVLLGEETEVINGIRCDLQNKVSKCEDKDLEEVIKNSSQDLFADLSSLKVVVVSGYDNVRKRIGAILLERFQISKFYEVPPSFEAHNNAKDIADKLTGADIILFMYRASKHADYYALDKALNSTGKDKLVYVPGKGHSSAMDAFEKYVVTEGLV